MFMCVFPEPYTARSARHHLACVLELLRASGPQDALREGRSPSILETLTHTQTQGTYTHTVHLDKRVIQWCKINSLAHTEICYWRRLQLTEWKEPEALFKQHKNRNNQPGWSPSRVPPPWFLRETAHGPAATELPDRGTYRPGVLFRTGPAHNAHRHTDSLLTLYLSHQAPSYMRDLSLSCWNPPPGHRKLQGDFLYITVVTMEGRRCDITSCPKGFFLNR